MREHSCGKTLYCLGNLYYNTIEVKHLEWIPHWADPEATVASRKALIATALAEDALLMAAHIPCIGCLHSAGQDVVWESVKEPDSIYI